jgi:hypothetical protein
MYTPLVDDKGHAPEARQNAITKKVSIQYAKRPRDILIDALSKKLAAFCSLLWNSGEQAQ